MRSRFLLQTANELSRYHFYLFKSHPVTHRISRKGKTTKLTAQGTKRQVLREARLLFFWLPLVGVQICSIKSNVQLQSWNHPVNKAVVTFSCLSSFKNCLKIRTKVPVLLADSTQCICVQVQHFSYGTAYFVVSTVYSLLTGPIYRLSFCKDFRTCQSTTQ